MALELWFIFSILSAILWASSSVIDKIIIPRYVKTPIVPIFIIGIFNLLTAIIVSLTVPYIVFSTTNLILSLLAGLLWGFVPFVYFSSLLTQDVSRIISLFSISPLLVLIFATLFLGEVLTYEKYLGTFAIILGSILITLNIDGRKRFSFNKKLLLVIAATFVISISQVLSKFVLVQVPYWNFYVWFALGFSLAAFLVTLTNVKILNIIKGLKARHLGFLVASRILGVSGLLSQVIALSYGLASLVSAIFSIQSLFILLFATILSFFNRHIEEIKGRIGLVKFIAAILIIFGVVVISL